MLNWKLLNKIIGSLLMIEATLMLVCSIMSLCYGESDTLPFISSTAITVFPASHRLISAPPACTQAHRSAVLFYMYISCCLPIMLDKTPAAL